MKNAKMIVTVCLCSAALLLLLAGCGVNQNNPGSAAADLPEEIAVDIKERGLELVIAGEYIEKGLEIDPYNKNINGYPVLTVNYYSPTFKNLLNEILAMKPEERTPEIDNEYMQKMWQSSRTLMEIALVETAEYEALTAAGKTPADFTYYAPAERLGENSGYTYIIALPELDNGSLNAAEQQDYQACKAYMQTLKENIKFIPLEQENNQNNLGEAMPQFSTQDLYGNTVTHEIFAQAKLTVVNVWGTFCGPCIEEMPELAEWAREMPEGVQIIGLVGDVAGAEDTERLQLAQLIVEKAGVDFVNIIANDDLRELLSGVIGYPTTFLVDSDGNLVGQPIVGAYVPGYKAAVEAYLGE